MSKDESWIKDYNVKKELRKRKCVSEKMMGRNYYRIVMGRK